MGQHGFQTPIAILNSGEALVFGEWYEEAEVVADGAPCHGCDRRPAVTALDGAGFFFPRWLDQIVAICCLTKQRVIPGPLIAEHEITLPADCSREFPPGTSNNRGKLFG